MIISFFMNKIETKSRSIHEERDDHVLISLENGKMIKTPSELIIT